MYISTTLKNLKRRLLFTGLLLLALTTAPIATPKNRPNGPARNGKHDSAIDDQARKGKHGRVQVIIRVVPGWRAALRDYLKSQGAHKIQKEHSLIDAITAELPADAIAALELQPFVQSVSIDAPLKAHQVTGTTLPPYL